MPNTFYAVDEEFAAASGSNVNSAPGRSIFDYPPNSTKNLVITSNLGDERPNQFDVGDEYDLTWQGNGGGNMDNATVIRSDYLAPGQGAIVFEGINSNTGELFQIVWSPGHDLEQWFFDNGGASNPPGFWTSEQDPGSYGYVCFTAGTLISTPGGQRPVQDLRPGDMVVTMDNGPQEIRWIGTKSVLGVGTAAPVVIEPGVLHNERPLAVSQQHRILLSGYQAELYFGQTEVWVPAKSLISGPNIHLASRGEVQYFHLLLNGHEVLLAENQPTESLFLGDTIQSILTGPDLHEIAQYFPPAPSETDASIAFTPVPGPVPSPIQCARMDLTFSEARILATFMGLVDPHHNIAANGRAFRSPIATPRFVA